MVDAIERPNGKITVKYSRMYDNYMADTFQAVKMFPNCIFVYCVTHLEDNWETDAFNHTPSSVDKIISLVHTE